MKKLHLILLCAAAMLAFTSLQSQNFVKVSSINHQQTVALACGQVLEIQLPKRPSNGYTWTEAASMDKAQRTIVQVSDEFTADPMPVSTTGKRLKRVGQAGTQTLHYEGTSQGTTVLTLELRRPWEKDTQPLNTFTITVVSAGKYNGSFVPPVNTIHKYSHPLTSPKTTLPTKWDWRAELPPIENQGSCGDCWAYATVGTLESNIKIHDGVTRDISEEFITDCMPIADSADFNGCSGGWCAHRAWLASYTLANSAGGGAVYETDDPTTCNGTGQTGNCGAPYTPHETISRYADIDTAAGPVTPPDSIKYHIYNHGPVWVTGDASNWNYSGGIWVQSSQSGIDHAICLVGWCDTTVADGSGGYWILRNSWGSSFGIAGYMYISYGSDSIGTYADYIVYKGGTLHNIPPVAMFSASTGQTCTGDISFTDESNNQPTSWLWNFGDGGTSTLQNPSHTYTVNGAYNVSLTATNTYGNGDTTITNCVTINMPAAPTVTGGSTTPGGSVTLHATGSDTLRWYTAPTGGTPVHTGTSYTATSLMTNDTLYVENDVMHTTQSAGLANKSGSGSYYTNTSAWALNFDALIDLTINSVKIYANSTNSKNIWLKNSSGTTLNTVSTSLSGTQVITLNFFVPAGTGYMLGSDAACDLWRDNAGAVFPYTTAGLISITGNTAAASGYYYYFYNWQVTGSPCTSPRVPVIAYVLTGINEFATNGIEIYPNPASDNFVVIASAAKQSVISIYNPEGQLLLQQTLMQPKTQIDISKLARGMYFIKVENDTGAMMKKFTKE